MGLFRKKMEENWEIVLEDNIKEDVPSKVPKNTKKNKKAKVSETPIYLEDDGIIFDEQRLQSEELNYLKSDANFVYQMEEESETSSHFKKSIIGSIVILLALSGVMTTGYFNTDFDTLGNAYVVTLPIHYERRYLKVSDDLYGNIQEVFESLNSNIPLLSSNYVMTADIMNKQIAALSKKTDRLSRFTDIPKSFLSYHDELLNLSLKTQEFLETLLENYNHSDFMAFANAGYEDFKIAVYNMRLLRYEIDDITYRNMEG